MKGWREFSSGLHLYEHPLGSECLTALTGGEWGQHWPLARMRVCVCVCVCVCVFVCGSCILSSFIGGNGIGKLKQDVLLLALTVNYSL